MLGTYPTTSYEPSPVLKARAELELRRRQRKRATFDQWLPIASPAMTWDAPHLRYGQQQLQRVTDGEIDKLMLFWPPRHGKSQMTTIRYPVWRMMVDPTMHVIVGAYNKTLADTFSRSARRIAREHVDLNSERQAAGEWTTMQGGSFLAAGVGTGVTGRGAQLIVIDDPVKSREEANSLAYRERVWNWYTDDLYTRLEPGGAIILIMTRWHEDDLAGRILASEDADSWTVVKLPALAEEDDPLGRAVDEPLWPARFDAKDLADIRTVMGTPSFTALYQQRPTALEGGMFKRDWFEIVDAAPANARRIRAWDKGGTDEAGDYTAGLKMAIDDDGILYVEDVVRGQWSALPRDRIMQQTAQMDTGDVIIWVEQEPGSGGKESAEATIRNLAGFAVHAERSTGDKAIRAEPFAAQCEAHNVKLVKAKWNAEYLDELTMFPNGKHDDMVDASSLAFNKLAGGPTWLI